MSGDAAELGMALQALGASAIESAEGSNSALGLLGSPHHGVLALVDYQRHASQA